MNSMQKRNKRNQRMRESKRREVKWREERRKDWWKKKREWHRLLLTLNWASNNKKRLIFQCSCVECSKWNENKAYLLWKISLLRRLSTPSQMDRTRSIWMRKSNYMRERKFSYSFSSSPLDIWLKFVLIIRSILSLLIHLEWHKWWSPLILHL